MQDPQKPDALAPTAQKQDAVLSADQKLAVKAYLEEWTRGLVFLASAVAALLAFFGYSSLREMAEGHAQIAVEKAMASSKRINEDLSKLEHDAGVLQEKIRAGQEFADRVRGEIDRGIESTRNSARRAGDDVESIRRDADAIKQRLENSGVDTTKLASALESRPSFVGAIAKSMEPVPVGTVVAFAGCSSKPPNGWLFCDGRLFTSSRIDGWTEAQDLKPGGLAALWEAVGNAWGPQDGDQRRLPNLCGRFLRGAGVDGSADRRVGKEEDAALKIGHLDLQPEGLDADGNGPIMVTRPPNASAPYGIIQAVGSMNSAVGGESQARKYWASGRFVVKNDGDETRPKNAAVKWIIKY